MQVNTNFSSSFPSQVVSNEEKNSLEYGLQVARAVEGEWFSTSRGSAMSDRFRTSYNNFHRLRLYARGEQPVQKYKDELSINGDLSYLNLDWKPIPIIPKFVDILVNGISSKDYDIKAFAQDPASLKARTEYAQRIQRDMQAKSLLLNIKNKVGLDLFNTATPEDLPANQDELDLHMQLDYKQSIEIAEEELINNTLAQNKYDLVKRRLVNDLTVLGIGAVKTDFNNSEGIVVKYVDPINLVYSYSEDPNFQDLYYVGEVVNISLPELKKQFPYLSEQDMKDIEKYPNSNSYARNWDSNDDGNTVQVLYFEYKTYAEQVFKIKQTATGLEKALEKPDTFNPPANDNFDRASRSIEVLYTGAKILGHDKMLKWEMADNMTRPFSNSVKVNMNYIICAPKMYKGRIESTVSRITGFADMIQLTHLKLQQVLSRIVPDGVFMDVDGLAEVDLGNGTAYNPQEALNMYFQTGSIVGRSMTQDGMGNPGKSPISELQSSGGQAKIASMIQTYQYYLQMIRDVTGLNEARDASTPDKEALVGLQKLAAANSNVATKHILQASLFLTIRACENICLRVNDALDFDLTAENLKMSIGSFNTGTLDDIKSLQARDFGIFLELEPDEEERAQLEQSIQIALQSGSIELEDAIDIRNIRNLKLANQYLKLKRKRKAEADRAQQQENMQMQAQMNAELAEKTALTETQKQQVLTEQQIEIEKMKSQFSTQKMEREAQIKMQLMQKEFEFNMQLAGAKQQQEEVKLNTIEDRKDKRTKLQATQQSEMIDQRRNNLTPINFESAGNDTLDGGFNLEQFAPK